MIKEHFIDYLAEIHAENYAGLDDDMPDQFEMWCEELGWEELMQYADDWRDQQVGFVAKEIKEMIIEQITRLNTK